MLSILRKSLLTHEGAKAKTINAEQQLRRSVMSCLLWEREFYEGGQTIADRMAALVPRVKAQKVAEIAVEARTSMKLRHVPLLLVREMARHASHKGLVAETLKCIVQRPDELSEFLAIYWKKGKEPLSAQVKKGLAAAFGKFDEYQLAKYDRAGNIKLRDVLFLCHAKAKDAEQEALWKRLIDGELAVPDTWEVSLSANNDVSKKAKWERLLKEKRLGAMALLRNLRNIKQEQVDERLVIDALQKMKPAKVLPFRFISAARYAPQWEPYLEEAMLKCLAMQKKLPGKTVLIVDVSGSMYGARLSARSDLDRAWTACALAVLVREVCEQPMIYATAGNDWTRKHATQQVPARRGFALADAIYNLCRPLGGGGIFLKQVMDFVYDKEHEADRVIVITDEQDCDVKNSPAKAHVFGKRNYLINVASARNGIGYDVWTHIDGWSEAVINYIQERERLENV
jgi:hypothetical protein